MLPTPMHLPSMMIAAILGAAVVIGAAAMAGSLQVFKEALIAKKAADGAAAVEAAAKIERGQRVDTITRDFEAMIGEIVDVVSSASTELEVSAGSLTATAERSEQLTTSVAAASEEASTNVQSVASATEEMASSVNEISRQVQDSARIASEAVEQARKTNDRVGELSKAAARIGDVVELINTIAGQTNLLGPHRAEPALHLRRARAADLLIIGPLAALRTPTDIFPDIRIPVIGVVWQYTGLPPDQMSGRITTPFERALTTTVNDIEHIEANSYNGFGIIKIFFQPNVDIRTANAQVTAISQTLLKQMPPGATPPLILNYNASTVPIIQLALVGRRPHRAEPRRHRHQLQCARRW
jgi:uncharacterized protein YoxC